ncbi:MAG: hypothetical protein OEY14_13350, partial [Myxococcales bacterium]|nr:hypothetical protein [Myxococcales bacterium]
MVAVGLAPSPLAHMLLELAERGADGTMEVGGRGLVLRAGALVDIDPGPDDQALEEFLVRTGRLEPDAAASCRATAEARGVRVETVIAENHLVRAKALSEARRALLLDRLVRGLAAEEIMGREPPAFDPSPPPATDADPIALVPLLLDALSRRAGEEDAGAVGERASDHLIWVRGPHLEPALRWSGLGKEAIDGPVSRFLARDPGAPSKIAALVRARLAHLATEGAPPPPPARPS